MVLNVEHMLNFSFPILIIDTFSENFDEILREKLMVSSD